MDLSRFLALSARVVRGVALTGLAAALMIAFFVIIAAKPAAAAVLVAVGAGWWAMCEALAGVLQRHAQRFPIGVEAHGPTGCARPRVRWDAVRRWRAAERRAS